MYRVVVPARIAPRAAIGPLLDSVISSFDPLDDDDRPTAQRRRDKLHGTKRNFITKRVCQKIIIIIIVIVVVVVVVVVVVIIIIIIILFAQ